MIRGNAGHLRIVSGSEVSCLLQVLQSIFVMLSFEFAKTEEIPGGPESGIEFHDFLESGDRIRKVVRVVLESAEVPPSLFPISADLNGSLVVTNCLFAIASLSRSGGRFCKILEISLNAFLRQRGWPREGR